MNLYDVQHEDLSLINMRTACEGNNSYTQYPIGTLILWICNFYTYHYYKFNEWAFINKALVYGFCHD